MKKANPSVCLKALERPQWSSGEVVELVQFPRRSALLSNRGDLFVVAVTCYQPVFSVRDLLGSMYCSVMTV